MNIFKSAALPLIAPLVASASLLGLAACSGDADAPTEAATPTLAEGITVSNARLVLAPVAGNPAAVYFDLSYAGDAAVTLASVTVDGAGMSMIHQTMEKDGAMTMMDAEPVTLVTGTPVQFAPGGLHVMAMQPSDAWKPGETVSITLTLSDGTTESFDAVVRAAGEER
ncbi:copper chaperone PCu(A)C [Porphyrobacter sp. AAP60]|uniref:copper chaperone PCu(A)C n=1 Tax=Porphyrobacter sp. AAP60 TaxID=1523423 RepID=UPI000AB88879|nr:copper chaperone PCu(A)C [Porphyrobacter sp. AAP60]